MNNQEYVLNAYKNALERVSAEIKRKPNQTEEALIFSSILLTILSMGIWEKPSNVMGRACAMSLFRFITFNADESYPSITQKYRQKLCLSQKDLDIQTTYFKDISSDYKYFKELDYFKKNDIIN